MAKDSSHAAFYLEVPSPSSSFFFQKKKETESMLPSETDRLHNLLAQTQKNQRVVESKSRC
jgi:hypothetical protein